ncbi:MAG: SpoVT / AbrB like domain protein [Candidatus Bathyarchaeota archaeon BA1]|nr:MAG: SpoVT / AbrB like domain protein [Candidatus Bathyarchaeota archaeon BA1]
MVSEVCCEERSLGGCKLEALVTLDEKGQIVIPKDLREKAKINAGDKLAVIYCEREGRVCCISLIRAEDLAESITKVFGPILREFL